MPYPLQFSDKPSTGVKVTTTTTTTQAKSLDFTDDPFRNYRYEDPFNIKFDDDEEQPPTAPSVDGKRKSTSMDAFGFSNSQASSAGATAMGFKDDKFDPFGLDGRQSVPLPASNLKAETCQSDGVSGRASAPTVQQLNEDQQLAWAARESLRLEEARKKRLLQEEADLKLAISLSKAESQNL